MTLTVRLDHKVEQTLAEYAVGNGISKSEAVKRGLKLLFESTPPQKSAYEIVGKINWSKAHYRRDIGYRAIARERTR